MSAFVQNIFIENYLGHSFYVDIMDDCGENEGGFYCRIYDENKLSINGTNFDDIVVIDFGDYFDDFCIHIGDCKFNNVGILNFVLNYIVHNITEKDFLN